MTDSSSEGQVCLRLRILGVAPTGRTVEFETVDVMKVADGRITDHWAVGNCSR